jgi:hypothetical protein
MRGERMDGGGRVVDPGGERLDGHVYELPESEGHVLGRRALEAGVQRSGSPLGDCVDVATLPAVAVVDGAPASVTAKQIAADEQGGGSGDDHDLPGFPVHRDENDHREYSAEGARPLGPGPTGFRHGNPSIRIDADAIAPASQRNMTIAAR